MGWGDLAEFAFKHSLHDLYRQGLYPRNQPGKGNERYELMGRAWRWMLLWSGRVLQELVLLQVPGLGALQWPREDRTVETVEVSEFCLLAASQASTSVSAQAVNVLN